MKAYTTEHWARLWITSRDKLRRLEGVRFWIARRMPRWLVYHCTIRLFAEVTMAEPNHAVTDYTVVEALCKWENR